MEAKDLLKIVEDIKTNLDAVRQGINLLESKLKEDVGEKDERDVWDKSTPYFDVLEELLKSLGSITNKTQEREK